MNWFRLIAFTAIWTIIFLVWARTDVKARWTALVFMTIPGLGLMCFWASYRGQFGEFWAGLGLGLVVTFLWWLFYGRRLPPSNSDNIKVWGQE